MATVFKARVPSLSLAQVPVFIWSVVATVFMLVTTLPVLAGGLTMILTDRCFNSGFFLVSAGGDPVLFQHLFWFFGHPEVYVLVLPVFGLVSLILVQYRLKTKVFGVEGMVFAILAITFVGFIV